MMDYSLTCLVFKVQAHLNTPNITVNYGLFQHLTGMLHCTKLYCETLYCTGCAQSKAVQIQFEMSAFFFLLPEHKMYLHCHFFSIEMPLNLYFVTYVMKR